MFIQDFAILFGLSMHIVLGANVCFITLLSPKAPLYNMSGHEEKILAVDWSIPSLLLSGAADNHLKIFQYKDTQLGR